MSIEGMSESKLNRVEQELYVKFIEKNPGMSEDDFLELRKDALRVQSPAAKKLFVLNGILMEEQPSSDDLHEIHEADKSVS